LLAEIVFLQQLLMRSQALGSIAAGWNELRRAE